MQEHGKVLTEEELQSLLDGTLDLQQVEGPKYVDPLDAHVIKAADVSRASVPQIGRLIYCFQGADKFNDGLWDGFVSSGELEQAILRIEVLLKAGTDLSGDGAPPVKG
ncbi:hypothetical protein [Prosthecobacter sp.]|uniref:hypothetical protein n=1 Tax=Prosthecobacter sp. TaxID=1965333 RepID=UPI0037833D8A